MTTIQSLGNMRGRARPARDGHRAPDDRTTSSEADSRQAEPMKIHYLEIVTTDVAATCRLYSAAHGVTFGAADPTLGGARTARLDDGLLGVRAPMHDGEKAVVRPYALVENIAAAVAAAETSGAEIIVPPMLLPGHGTCAIVSVGGIEAGLWQM
jgi:predicted enzyme related to lactoylglutathione lyase